MVTFGPDDPRGEAGPAPLSDRLHRLVKLALDTGEAESVEAATARFAAYRLAVDVGPDVARSASLQAAVLTAVNAGRRCFLGGVDVTGELDVPLLVPYEGHHTLTGAVRALGGRPTASADRERPRVVVGDGTLGASTGPFAVRATAHGWSGGVVPLASGDRLDETQECVPAGVLAGALAVSEAFQFVRGDTPEAGRRATGLSLWTPDAGVRWDEADPGPALELLPAKLWLIGLGHLGQAYLWTLGLLPYAEPRAVSLVLQDFDTLVEANDSTSPLTTLALVGQKKARAMASWAERRGFNVTVVERRFGANFTVADDEPRVAWCGVDNAVARAALEDVGFERVIEAGLGRGTEEYLALQVHTMPSARPARARWGAVAGAGTTPVGRADALPAYRDLAARGLDACGLTSLAGRSVGASFVGVTAAALVVAETLRLALGAPTYGVIDASLRALDRRQTVRRELEGVPYNPGVTRTALPYELARAPDSRSGALVGEESPVSRGVR